MTTNDRSRSAPVPDEPGRLTLDDYICGDIRVRALYSDTLTDEDLHRAARTAGCHLLLSPGVRPRPRSHGWLVRLITHHPGSYRDLHAAWTADNQASGDQHGVWLSLLYDLDEHLAIDYPDPDNGGTGSCTDRVFFHHVTSGRFTSANLVERPPSDGSATAIFVPIDHAR